MLNQTESIGDALQAGSLRTNSLCACVDASSASRHPETNASIWCVCVCVSCVCVCHCALAQERVRAQVWASE